MFSVGRDSGRHVDTPYLVFGAGDRLKFTAGCNETRPFPSLANQSLGGWAYLSVLSLFVKENNGNVCTFCVVSLACFTVRHVCFGRSPCLFHIMSLCAYAFACFFSQGGVAPDAPDVLRGSTPLHWACFG